MIFQRIPSKHILKISTGAIVLVLTSLKPASVTLVNFCNFSSCEAFVRIPNVICGLAIIIFGIFLNFFFPAKQPVKTLPGCKKPGLLCSWLGGKELPPLAHSPKKLKMKFLKHNQLPKGLRFFKTQGFSGYEKKRIFR